MTEEDLKNIISKDAIEIGYEAIDKNDAIRRAGKLLQKTGYVEESYVEAMIQVCEELGPYIVLIPGLAMPHARPENGAKKLGISILKLKSPVVFGHPENDPVSLIIALSAPDNNSHLELLSFLSEIFMNENSLNELLLSNSTNDLYEKIMQFAS